MTAEQIEALGSKTGKGAGLSSRPPEKEDLEAGAEWAEKLQHLDPLLKLIAALPFLKDLEDQRAVYIRTKVIDALEEHNWDIRGAVHRLWAGERKVEVLTRGKGAHTAAIIEIMLKNTQENDAKYGYKTYLAPKA
ncbi:hypothetical protein H632_c1362p0 [Helicosporidium sp. ATCC 50920]|nr:hypothetical protein H632_c1362p0 [Helicosporidium sp. ATCC 50920]|eukprot:KDD74372.1 hypothetical protein H632_c1362p0 [Helicosporidium sp. ATCC 50920]